MSVSTIFEATDADGDLMLIQTRHSNPSGLYMRTDDAVFLTREQVTELHTALGEWLASTEPTPEVDEPTTEDVERDAHVAELARTVASLARRFDALGNPALGEPAALTHIHGRIDRLAARINTLEASAAEPSPLYQAIADEIRRAAGR